MVSCVPITNQNGYIPIRGCERNGNYGPVIYNKPTIPSRCSLEIKRWEVKEAPNLILNLKIISPIPLWGNWTIGSKNSILPWTTPLLNSGPITQNPVSETQSIYNNNVSDWKPWALYSKSNQVNSRFSSNLFRTLTTTLLLVVTLITGPGNFPLMAITCKVMQI